MQGGDYTTTGDDIRTRLNEAIEMAVSAQIPINMIPNVLADLGWPLDIVNSAIEEYVRTQKNKWPLKTSFKAWLKKYQTKAYPAVALVVVVSTIQALFALLNPWPIKIMADSAFGDVPAPWILEPLTGQPALIAATAIMSIVIFLVAAAFSWASDYLLLKIGYKFDRAIKSETFRHILHLPLFHQQRLAKGDYIYRQSVVTESLSDLVLSTTSSIISSIIMIIGVLAIMLFFNPVLTLVSIVLIPLLYLTTKHIGPFIGRYTKKLTHLNSKVSSIISESIDNAETIQTFTLEDKQLLTVGSSWDQGYRLSRKSLFWSNLLSNSNSLLIIIATSVVMYFGGTAALNGDLLFGELFIFMTYMGYLLGPIESLVNQITTRNQKKIDVDRIYEVLSDHEGIEDLRKDSLLPPAIQGFVEFKNVSYSYSGQAVFNNLNLQIHKGEKIAIIGPSGSGKSTILKLLPLFLQPESGSVLIDGYDTQQYSLQDLRRKIGWVSQSPQLFTGTIADNLYDADVQRDISADEMRYAIDVANVTEFAIKLPMGINSPVGENGSSLSGGQRQRVAIARALLKNAPILCLDEPTAALDAKSENYIRDSLSEIIRDKTVLMVTHRRPLLALMDTVYVMDEGQLRNVNDYGGIDAYMQLLEGIAEQQVVDEIAEEQNYVLPTVIDEHIGLDQLAPQAPHASPQPATQLSTNQQAYTQPPAGDYIAHEQTPVAVTPPADPIPPTQAIEDQEVYIKLK